MACHLLDVMEYDLNVKSRAVIKSDR
jgi:hypothetical protein